MRYVNFVLFLLMILFIAVQYNDPDGTLWMLIYAIPAIWAGIGAFRPGILFGQLANVLLLLCLGLAFAGTIYFWPDMSGWWQKDVWIQELTGETAREGMGMMILTVVLVIVWLGVRLGNRPGELSAQSNQISR